MADRTEREELLEILSDVFKSANGFRPRGMYSDYTVAQLRSELKRLENQADAEMDRKRAQEDACAVKFEARIAELIACGARDRATAIRWDKDTWGDHIDDGYYEYLNGLRYGYFQEMAVAA